MHIFIRAKDRKEWIDIGSVSKSFKDTKEGIIEELDKRMQEMAMATIKHYGIIKNGSEMEYYIGELPPDKIGATFH